MARRKTKPAQPAASKANGSQEPADAPRLRTEAELQSAEQDARQRKQAALAALAKDDKHPTAVRDLNAAKRELRQIEDDRADLRELRRLQSDARTVQAEQAQQAAFRKVGAAVVAELRANGKDADELVMHFNSWIERAVRITQRNQSSILPGLHSLPGDERTRGMAVRAAANVGLGIGRLLRPALIALSRNKYLETWINVERIPSEPDAQPIYGNETHKDAAARIAALPKTASEIYEAAAADVAGFINTLLGPEPEPVDPEDIQPWYGRSEAERPDSFNALMERGELAIDTSAQDQRRAQRIADSAKPITRDGEGKVVATGEDLT